MCTKPSTPTLSPLPSTLTKKKAHVLNKGTVVISSTVALFALRALPYMLNRYTLALMITTIRAILLWERRGGSLVFALYSKCTCNTCTSPDMYNNLA